MTTLNDQCTFASKHAASWFIACVIGIAVMVAAVAAGRLVQGDDGAASAVPPQAFDSMRQVLFVADPCCGAVRVLHLRNSIGELAVLRSSGRTQVRDIALDSSKRWLWVLGDDAVERYDALSLKSTGRFPLLAGQATKFARVERDGYVLRTFPVQADPKA